MYIFSKKKVELSEIDYLPTITLLIPMYNEEKIIKYKLNNLKKYMTSGPVIAMVVEGPKVVMLMRKLCGGTFVEKADPGTIRGDYALGSINPNNVIHASDSVDSAKREIAIFFKESEINQWENPFEGWA